MQKLIDVDESTEIWIAEYNELVFNPDNPNVMDERAEMGLSKSLKEWSYIEFVAGVHNGDGRLFVIDGEHRARQMHSAGRDKFPVIVAKNITRDQARLGSFTFNKWRGKLDAQKVSKLLLTTLGDMKTEEVTRLTGIDGDAIKRYTLLSKISEAELIPIGTRREVLQSIPIASIPRTLVLSFSEDEHKLIMRILQTFDLNLSKAIVKLCRWYEEQCHTKASS
jgi:hypothetical protein